MNHKKGKFIVYGTMLTAGTAIGGGIFSIPVVSSGMWFILSVFSLVVIWALSYVSSLYILEANTHFKPGASFDTISRNLLGKTGNIVLVFSLGVLMYSLLYAYFSALGNLIPQTLGWNVDNRPYLHGLISIIAGGVLAFFTWFSTKMVGKISTIIVIGMAVTFIISMSGFALNVDTSVLFNTKAVNQIYHPYIWAALPYYITSLGIATVVPSLYKFFGKDIISIKKSLLYGSLLALLIYILFLYVSFGNIPRTDFVTLNKAGGNIGNLVAALTAGESNNTIIYVLNIFSIFAITTSFLGVGLALFDFIMDKFHLLNTSKGRLKASVLAFVPPGLGSFFVPNGFIVAIGFAGLLCILSFFIVPYFMIRKIRSQNKSFNLKISFSRITLLVFLFMSIAIALLEVASLFQVLPKW